MKLAGFLTGAAVAGAAVWGFNAWRHVSDAERLVAVISDHCIPYVQTGADPFEGMGRPVGVYDQAALSERLMNGGNAIIFENRFIAQWGESADENSAVRVCQVDYSYIENDAVGFALEGQDAITLVDALVGADFGLSHALGEMTQGPSVLTWRDPNAPRFVGMRIILVAQTAGVSKVSVVNDVPD